MSKINLPVLRQEIRKMDCHKPLYRLLRDELDDLGYWRRRPRGNPAKGYRVMVEKTHPSS